MKTITKFLAAALVFGTSSAAVASDDEPITIGGVAMENSSSSAAFAAVKKKLGKWEGQMTQSITGAVFDVSYEWKLTSGGNTITETIVEDGVVTALNLEKPGAFEVSNAETILDQV